MRSQAMVHRLTPIKARYEPMRSQAIAHRLTPIKARYEPLRFGLRFERSGPRRLDS